MQKISEESDDLTYAQAYIKLRTYIDAFQANAITYCFEDDDLTNRKTRFKEVEEAMTSVLKLVRGTPDQGNCENGFYDCDGVCVPYPCSGIK